jgi:hypothetical protein
LEPTGVYGLRQIGVCSDVVEEGAAEEGAMGLGAAGLSVCEARLWLWLNTGSNKGSFGLACSASDAAASRPPSS